MTHELPHDLYISAVTDTFTAVGLDPADTTLDDCDTRGLHCYLRAILTFDAATSRIDPARWPHGLILIWEWHTGIEAADGEPDRGPVWLWAALLRDGSTGEPALLPVDGYANPVQVAAAVHELDETGTAAKHRPGRWDCAVTLDNACTVWAAQTVA